MVNETSIKTTRGCWHGSHLYGKENTCILIVRVNKLKLVKAIYKYEKL